MNPAQLTFDTTALPLGLAGPGQLHLRCSGPSAAGEIARILRVASWLCTQDDDLLTVDVPGGSLSEILSPLASSLSPVQQHAVRVVFKPAGEATQLADYFETGSLSRFLARRRSGWLIDMMREDRLTSIFQPIVSAPDGQVFGYECLLRGLHDGEVVESTPILQVAGGAGLLFHVDMAARWLAIREAAKHDIRDKLFINFTLTDADNPIGCLRSTVELLDELGIETQQVVFEVIESEHVIDLHRLGEILRCYRDMGFGVALDDVGAGYASLNVLQKLRPDYAKLDAQLIRDVDTDAYKAVLTAKLLEASSELGVKTIAEGVETPGEHAWLRAHGADYLQGYYLARPGSPPPLPRCSGAIN